MGAEPYWYVVPYEPDVNAALQKLRGRELVAGRYNPVVPFLEFPVDPNEPARGQHHGSFAEAFEAAMEDGTRSIIDIESVSQEAGLSESADQMVHPLSDQDLMHFFGTTQPTLKMILGADDFWSRVSRGSGAYIVLFEEGKPKELFFAGYSFD